jgi:NTE family protein
MYADGVFEGGGVKGIGLVGAVCCLEDNGYKWMNLAGTSSGAIVAALLAAGYTGKELKCILDSVDYAALLDKNLLQSIPIVGKALGILLEYGIYSGDEIEKWIRELLQKKGRTKFKDVSLYGRSRLRIIASDVTRKEMIIIPDELSRYGINPMEFDIAKAVRMSIGIPFYFKPVILKSDKGKSYIVDGGVSSIFPVWIFDVEGNPRWPTFGLKLEEENRIDSVTKKRDIITYASDIIDTMVNRREEYFVRDKDLMRIISIPTVDVGTKEFNLTKEKCKKLYASGYNSARKFLGGFSFETYIKKYGAIKEI